MLRDFGASDRARQLINANFNGNHIDTMSALHIARSAAIFRSMPGPVRTIAGGSQRLPEAMAAALAGDVRLRSRVIGVREAGGAVSVRLADGVHPSRPPPDLHHPVPGDAPGDAGSHPVRRTIAARDRSAAP